MRKISPEERQIMRRSYAEKIMETVRTEGFISLTILDLAHLMGISRASLYNFFASKEDIILEVTEIYIDYLKKTNHFINNSRFSYVQRLPTVFEQSAFSAVYASEIYLDELKSTCPDLYKRKLEIAAARIETLHTFYTNGISDEDFNPLNPSLVVAQDEAALRKILNSSFMSDEGLSLEESMYGYYEIMKHRTFSPSSLKKEQDPYIKNVVEVIVRQLTKIQ
ncbi:AcrR family transcriptional regulator [Planomicrobium stackebrandtii]|uniref:AcrR family transcriptional regulator n=1 Tax=Planomicrobium stackebrandtii TaxID=253160 RepID=A0ABU0GPU8_9BACL|nr:TetR/AcrR family transcriptional regulator [Planomicrobium stackebrandtii]MDQ0427376.1 AcrR family transcriptional regulator [Planomicrobium stackebrandtii]